ncbi:hypothetical protein OAV13_00715 [bacterium]|jgi:hypothetical protein|nr:hypothetical protein [bacterium]
MQLPIEDQLEEAVTRCVESWDMDTLMNFAIDEMFDYYVSADEETVKYFIAEQLGESNG